MPPVTRRTLAIAVLGIATSTLRGQQPTATGGERWWIFDADGRTVREAHDAGDRWRPFELPPAREVTITSAEADIPLLSELLLANLLARAGRVPSIVTGSHTSTLVGNAWLQVKR